MTDDLVAMLRKDFSADMKHEYPQTCLTEYEYERQKASDRIDELEAALKRYETVYKVSRVYHHEMPDSEVFGVPSFTDGKRLFPMLSDEYDLYVARTSPDGGGND
jgi:hypothetical protein